jgi:Cation transporter/ATPase, N-terminus
VTASVIAGLSSLEASRRLAADGPNQLPEPRRPSALRHLGKQFIHLLANLLWVASGLALLAGQPALAAAIVVVIVLNAVFAFAQEYRADRSAERMRSLLPMSARVRRDGQLRVVDASQLVRGDLVVLRPGDPACTGATIRTMATTTSDSARQSTSEAAASLPFTTARTSRTPNGVSSPAVLSAKSGPMMAGWSGTWMPTPSSRNRPRTRRTPVCGVRARDHDVPPDP